MAYPPPDWRNPADYAWLEEAGHGVFAWEWLRRSEAYRAGWSEPSAADRFGLVQCEPPWLDARDALPLWSKAHDHSVLVGRAVPLRGAAQTQGGVVDFVAENLELRRVRVGGTSHLLLGHRADPIRVDLIGELSAAEPLALHWELIGLDTLAQPLGTLQRLAGLREDQLSPSSSARVLRVRRQIVLLRCADAISRDASHQQIARGIFGALVPEMRWRVEAGSVRLRVQRLVGSARARIQCVPRIAIS